MKALEIATRSIGNIAAEMSVIAHNVAVADIENNEEVLIAKEASFLNSQLLGANIKGYYNNVDLIVQSNIYDLISSEAYHSEIYKADQFINSLMGRPGSNNDIATELKTIFDGISELSINASNPNAKAVLMSRMQRYVSTLNSIAASIEEQRYQIDQRIVNDITVINQIMVEANLYNSAAFSSLKGSIQHLQNIQQFRARVEQLSQYFEVIQIDGVDGKNQLFLKSGQTLVSGVQQHFLKYDGANSVKDFINDVSISGITLSSYNNSGIDTNQNIPLVKAGKTSDRASYFSSGSIGGMLEVRDVKLPLVLKQINSLAQNLAKAFNAVHNKGVGHPPPTKLEGSNLVSRNNEIGFTGKARLSIINSDGMPVANIPSMLLNFDTLDTGSGTGKVNVAGIINEINYFFGQNLVSQNRAEVGNLHSIKLASMQKVNAANSTFALDFDLENRSSNNATFTINSITGTDGNGGNLNLSITNNQPFVVQSGIQARTGNNSGPIINIANGSSLNYPYTISCNVTVTPADGTGPSTNTITYTVVPDNLDPFNGLMNVRFAPSAIETGNLLLPVVSSQPITASLKRDNASLANSSTAKGQLILESGSTNWGIAIDVLDSKDNGILATKTQGTALDFSSYFGLNDLFSRRDDVGNWESAANYAYYLQIRPDIAANPDFIATGKLRPYTDFSLSSTPTTQYQIVNGDFENGHALFEVQNDILSFVSSDGKSLRVQSLQNYAASLLGYTSVQENVSEDQYTTVQSALNTTRTKFMNFKGVNVNEQMTHLISLMAIQNANGRIIGVQQRFFDTLFEALR